MRVEITALDKTYGQGEAAALVLDHANAVFEVGEYVAIVGRSGSGKSTLLNLLGCLDDPSGGDVLFDGCSLSGMSEIDKAALRREKIGFVFQAFNLVPTLTVRENLLVPMQLNRRPREAAMTRISSLLRTAGLESHANRFPSELSGGEQQRVAVLRAIVHEPSLVIADEPTGNLDLATARETLDLLEACGHREGRTLIMATHSDEVIGRAERVLRIRAGRLEPLGAEPVS